MSVTEKFEIKPIIELARTGSMTHDRRNTFLIVRWTSRLAPGDTPGGIASWRCCISTLFGPQPVNSVYCNNCKLPFVSGNTLFDPQPVNSL